VIEDDDRPAIPPSVSVASAAASEEDGRLVFTVTLSAPSSRPVIVAFTTAGGTAAIGADFIGAAGTLTFAPGEISKTIEVVILHDEEAEVGEAFFLELTSAVGASIGQFQAKGTILSDDRPKVAMGSAAPIAQNERPAQLEQSYSEPPANNFNSPPGAATAGVPLAGAESTNASAPRESAATAAASAEKNDTTRAEAMLSLAPSQSATPGSEQAIVAVGAGIVSDVVEVAEVRLGSGGEGEEVATPVAPIHVAGADPLDDVAADTFVFNFSSVGNSAPADAAAAGMPAEVSISDAVASETGGLMRFVVTLSQPASEPIIVEFELVPVTATGDTAESARGTLTFEPGEASQSVTVAIHNDALVEANETFLIRLRNPAGAVLGDGQAVGTIIDDDLPANAAADPISTFAPASVTDAPGLVPASLSNGADGMQAVPIFDTDYTLLLPLVAASVIPNEMPLT
jgi:chitinase